MLTKNSQHIIISKAHGWMKESQTSNLVGNMVLPYLVGFCTAFLFRVIGI
jgi:hypothetical protein